MYLPDDEPCEIVFNEVVFGISSTVDETFPGRTLVKFMQESVRQTHILKPDRAFQWACAPLSGYYNVSSSS